MANETMNLNTPILTLDSDTVLETAQSKADLIWHDIQNAYRTRKILTGILGGIEKTEAGSLIAIIYYKDYRAVIPISEMMINLIQDETHDYGDFSLRQNKVLNNMLGSEIDFVIKGLDTKSRSIVASRKDAMLKKRQIFYFDQDSSGQNKIHEDRIVQARVIAVAEKVVRAEIFGVETSILARDLSFDWLGDARERFQVGEYSGPDLSYPGRFPGNALYPCRCKKRGRQHQQRKSEKLSGTRKICRYGGRHPQRNCFCPVRIGCQRHCSQLLRQPHRWEER